MNELFVIFWEIAPEIIVEGAVSNKLNSSSTTILNSAPLAQTNPTLTPSTNIYKTNASVTCNVGTAVDADSDVLSDHYLWFDNNITTANITQSILNSSYNKGSALFCQWYVDDGTANSGTMNSTTINVLNSPSTPGVDLSLINGTRSLWDGMKFDISPMDTHLDNNTWYNLTYDMKASYQDIVLTGFNLTFSNGSTISQTSTRAGGDLIRILVYTGQNTTITGTSWFTKVDGQTGVIITKWVIFKKSSGEFSALTIFKDMFMFSGLGVNAFTKLFIIFCLIVFLTVMISRAGSFGIEGTVFISMLLLTIVFVIQKAAGPAYELIEWPVYSIIMVFGFFVIIGRIITQ